MTEKLFCEVDNLYEKYLSIWETFCNIESPTECKQGVDKAADYLTDIAVSLGLQVEAFEHKNSGKVLCITLNPEVNEAPLSISGHIDTVHPIGSFGNPPVHRDTEKIYGPGVLDCKGGVVAGLLALEALKNSGYKKRPVQLLVQSDEENGSKMSEKATIKYICEKAKNSVAFLNLEGHTQGKACLVRKGIVTFKFSVFGKAAHAATCAVEGANAIADAAYKIIELEKIKDDKGVTCNCGIVSGGTAVNTVPDKCEFLVNIRYVNSEQLDWITEKVYEIAATEHIKGCTCEVKRESFRTAMEYTERNAKLLDRMNEIFLSVGLPVLEASARNGGSDAADVTAFGIPCVDNIGVTGGNIHSLSEFAFLNSLSQAAKRVVAVAESI